MKKSNTILGTAAVLMACVMTIVAAESTPGSKPSGVPEQKNVTLVKPYPLSYPGAPTDKISVQYAVIELGKQAGLHYDWNTSAKNTGELARRWIYPDIKNQPFDKAMKDILAPLALTYQIKGGNIIVLTK